MAEDTYTRSGCAGILKHGGAVQWWEMAIVKEKVGALEHSRKLR